MKKRIILILVIITAAVFVGCESPEKPKEKRAREIIEKIRMETGELKIFPLKEFTEIGKPAVKPLIEALKDDNVSVRLYAILALAEIKDKRAVEPLIESLKYKNWEVRSSAAYALGWIGDKRAVQPLIGMLKDRNDYVRYEAAYALKKITGKDFGEDYKKWKEWYEEQSKK